MSSLSHQEVSSVFIQTPVCWIFFTEAEFHYFCRKFSCNWYRSTFILWYMLFRLFKDWTGNGYLSLNLGIDVLHERVPLHQHVREGGAREDPHHLNTDWSDWSHMTFLGCSHWLLKILTTWTPGWSDWSHMTFCGCSHWLLKILTTRTLIGQL